MVWLSIVGLCFDLAGALLVLGSILLLRKGQIRTFGALYPSGGPSLDSMRELTYTWTGAALLIVGFGVQLAAYIWKTGHGWAIAVGAGTAAVVVALGAGCADALARFLLRRFTSS